MPATRIQKTSLIIFMLLLLANCASESHRVEPRGDGAYLQNRTERQGQAKFIYVFEYANGLKLKTGGVVRNPIKLVNKIQPGRTVVGFKITYTPAYGKNIFAMSNDRYYFIFVRDLGFSEERIERMSELAPDLESVSLSGLKGLSFDAERGHTYQIGCKIENGRAHVWIEEPDGSIVSDSAIGFADAQYVVQTTMELGMPGPGVPDLRGGWKVLDDLPDPVY